MADCLLSFPCRGEAGKGIKMSTGVFCNHHYYEIMGGTRSNHKNSRLAALLTAPDNTRSSTPMTSSSAPSLSCQTPDYSIILRKFQCIVRGINPLYWVVCMVQVLQLVWVAVNSSSLQSNCFVYCYCYNVVHSAQSAY
jgi:hypothetical protein